ncbi:hypothetical protein ACZ87_01345, partial [Candidatus Erwinia dacicola]
NSGISLPSPDLCNSAAVTVFHFLSLCAGCAAVFRGQLGCQCGHCVNL